MNIFISYCHEDKGWLTAFLTHLKPLVAKGDVECWYDGVNLAGSIYQDGIDRALVDSDIVCLMVTPSFLGSNPCMEELKIAADAIPNGKLVIPVIVKDCLWKENPSISGLLALPEDGTPVADFPRAENAWTQVCEGVKKLIFRNTYPIETEEFSEWKSQTELSSILNSQETLTLEDLFVGFDLEAHDISNGNVIAKTSYEDLLGSLLEESFKVIVSGGQQAGKTALLKKLHSFYVKDMRYLPVYFDMEPSKGKVNLQKAIHARINEQYKDCEKKELLRWPKILPLIPALFV